MIFKRSIIFTILFLLTSISLTLAQGTCPAIVEEALESLGNNCETLGRNTACYGYNLVSAQFSEAVEDDFFTQPADTSGLGILESIQTAEMDTSLSQWGVAVMNVQANIPNSIPGQAVKFVLLGDVEVESAVEPDNTFESVDGITVATTAAANIRSGPSLNFNVIGGASIGDSLVIDGTNATGDWYRTAVGTRVGWIFGELLEANDSLAELPIIDGQQRSLMQAFYLRTGVGTPACDEAPSDTLVVQGPEDIEIDLTVNGADIRLGSTIAMRILPPGDIIEFTVIDGQLTVIGGGPDGEDLIVPANHRTTACLQEPDDLGVDGDSNDRVVGCEFTTPEFVPEPDLGDAFCVLEDVPSGLLNYGVDLSCPDDLVQLPSSNPPDVNDVDPATDNATGNDDIIGGASSNPPEVTNVEPSTPEPSDGEDIVVGAGNDPNLCFEGNAWGDGRCRTDYDWQAGYYFGQVEAGNINLEDIPAPFYVTPTPFPQEEKKKSNPVKGTLGCGASINEYEVTITGIVSSDSGASVFYDIGATTFPFGSISVPPILPQTVSNIIAGAGIENVTIVSEPSGKKRNLGDINCP